MYRSLEDMMVSAAEAIRPSERLSVSEVATRHRKVNNPGSYIGPWDHDIAPYLVEIMDTLTSEEFRALIFAGPARCGKALALDTPLATPSGWTTMGEVQAGDYVLDADGRQTLVTATSEIQVGRPCYEVVFSDGARIVADAEHEWEVDDLTGPVVCRTLTTQAMADKLPRRNGRARFAVRTAAPLQLAERDLPLPPYTMGAWLGDGHSIGAQDASAMIENLNREGHSVRSTARDSDGFATLYVHDGWVSKGRAGAASPMSAALRRYGMGSARLKAKHIPAEYLRGSFEQRLALLQGLMDTDGYVDLRGICEFCTTSPLIAEGVRELFASLGVKFSETQRAAADKVAHRFQFKPGHRFPVFRLERKQSRVNAAPDTNVRVDRRYIVSFDPIESVPVRCIRVDNPRHLFLAGREMVPTHNSDTFMNWMASSALYDPADMMVVHMTQATARDWSISDLGKVFRHSPDIGARLKPGKQYDNVFDKLFVGDTRLMIKWPTISELSGKTVPRCWIMDYDRMDDDIDGEGSPFDLTFKRTQTYGRFGMTVAESSPGRIIETANWIGKTPHEAPPTTGILALYNRGDRRRFYWRCDDCRLAFEPNFRLLDWPDSADHLESAEMAVMRCPHCGHPHHHDQNPHGSSKRELNIAGRWIKDGQQWRPDGTIEGTGVRSETASFWLKGVCAAFASWKDIVVKYLAAMKEYEDTGAEEALKTTTNVDQGEPYTPKARETDRLPETLKARARDLGQRVVPVGTRFLLATVDVQSGARSRFVVQVHGVGEGGDIYIVDRFEIEKSARVDADGERMRLDPGAYLEDWNLLKAAVIQKTYPLGDRSGRHMAIRLVGCDSGGSEGVTANAYAFWRALRNDTETPGLHRRFVLLKGTSKPDVPRVRLDYPDSGRKDRNAGGRGEIPVLFLNANMLKDQLDKMLERTSPGGGQIYFPLWLPDKWYVELTVEVKTAKGWENLAKKRNESWDLLYYCLGLMVYPHVGVEHIDWRDPPEWAREWDQGNSLIFDPVLETRKFEPVAKPRTSLADLAAKLA